MKPKVKRYGDQIPKYKLQNEKVDIAKIEIEDKLFNLVANQSCFVPIGAKHRLTNPGKEKLVIIEVQSGTYLGEDDIIRFQDKYGREVL